MIELIELLQDIETFSTWAGENYEKMPEEIHEAAIKVFDFALNQIIAEGQKYGVEVIIL